MAIERLKKRREYLRVREKGVTLFSSSFVFQAMPSQKTKVGFTVTKKIGSAVRRNFVKRRMRHMVEKVTSHMGMPNMEMVLIARSSSASKDFSSLCAEYKKLLEKVTYVR